MQNAADKVTVLRHPLIQIELTTLRDKRTNMKDFVQATRRIGLLLAMEATRDLSTISVKIETPLAEADGVIARNDVVIVTILRAALGLEGPIREIIPDAKVHHLGIRRDEGTALPHFYYPHEHRRLQVDGYVILNDPMLATGGSACAALQVIKKAGARNIRFVCVVAAPEGIDAVASRHPDVRIITAAVDSHLNERKYIVPGLGDFGDRLNGT